MVKDFNKCDILTVNKQAVADSVASHADIYDSNFDGILETIEALSKCSLPTLDGSPIHNLEKKICANLTQPNGHDPMTIDFNTYGANGSLQNDPTASRVITPILGQHAPAAHTHPPLTTY